MRPLCYLAATVLKNQLKELVRKPFRLIFTLLVAGFLVMMLMLGSDIHVGAARPLTELAALAAAAYTVVFLLTVNAGFSRGGNLFTLSDAMLLFTAPIQPRTVLFYGLLRQIKTCLLVGLILLFQYMNLRMLYSIRPEQMVGLLALYAATVFLGNLCAMAIYAFVSGDEHRKLPCRVALFALYFLALLIVFWKAASGGGAGLADRAVEAASGPLLWAVPVSGWMGRAALGLLQGSATLVWQGVGLCALALAALLALLLRMDPDYYEDVMKSAEISYSAIAAKKEGTMQEAAPAHVRVGKTGLRKGWGASVYFHKHLLENRRSRKLILSTSGLIYSGFVLVYAFFMREDSPVQSLVLATYMQLFSALTTGRFNYELSRPYLYLTPEPPMKKLLWALAETAPATVIEALVVMVPMGLILGLGPMGTAAAVVLRISFAAVLLSADVAAERLWEGGGSKVLARLLYLFLALVIAVPGFVMVFVAGLGGSGLPATLLAMSAGNLLASILVFFLCRDLLEYADLSNQ